MHLRCDVDVDDQSTWSRIVAERVAGLSARLKGTTEFTSDLRISWEEEGEFRSLLEGNLVRAYHCTRQLDHEVEMIREQGLRMLTEQLLVDRVNALWRTGTIK
jgi:hypothetical protein